MPRLSNVASCGQLCLHSQSRPNSMSIRPRSGSRGLQRESYVQHLRRKCAVPAWDFEGFSGRQPTRISLAKKLPQPSGREKVTVTDLLTVEGDVATRGGDTPLAKEKPSHVTRKTPQDVVAKAPLPPSLPGAIAVEDYTEEQHDAAKPAPPPTVISRQEDSKAARPTLPPVAASADEDHQQGSAHKSVVSRRHWSPSRIVSAAAENFCHWGGTSRKPPASSAVIQVAAGECGNDMPSVCRPSSKELPQTVLSTRSHVRSASLPASLAPDSPVAYFSDHASRGGRARKKPRPICTSWGIV